MSGCLTACQDVCFNKIITSDHQVSTLLTAGMSMIMLIDTNIIIIAFLGRYHESCVEPWTGSNSWTACICRSKTIIVNTSTVTIASQAFY